MAWKAMAVTRCGSTGMCTSTPVGAGDDHAPGGRAPEPRSGEGTGEARGPACEATLLAADAEDEGEHGDDDEGDRRRDERAGIAAELATAPRATRPASCARVRGGIARESSRARETPPAHADPGRGRR